MSRQLLTVFICLLTGLIALACGEGEPLPHPTFLSSASVGDDGISVSITHGSHEGAGVSIPTSFLPKGSRVTLTKGPQLFASNSGVRQLSRSLRVEFASENGVAVGNFENNHDMNIRLPLLPGAQVDLERAIVVTQFGDRTRPFAIDFVLGPDGKNVHFSTNRSGVFQLVEPVEGTQPVQATHVTQGISQQGGIFRHLHGKGFVSHHLSLSISGGHQISGRAETTDTMQLFTDAPPGIYDISLTNVFGTTTLEDVELR